MARINTASFELQSIRQAVASFAWSLIQSSTVTIKMASSISIMWKGRLITIPHVIHTEISPPKINTTTTWTFILPEMAASQASGSAGIRPNVPQARPLPLAAPHTGTPVASDREPGALHAAYVKYV